MKFVLKRSKTGSYCKAAVLIDYKKGNSIFMENNLIDTLSGLDKAAILFQVLGESLALTMFQGLSESDLLKIRVRTKELKNIPFDVKQSILEEF